MTNEDNILLTPDCLGIEAKRAALDRLLAQERERTIRECMEIANDQSNHLEESNRLTESGVATSIAFKIYLLLKKGDTK